MPTPKTVVPATAALAAVALALAASPAAPTKPKRPRGVVVNCATRSLAAFSDDTRPDNVATGPLTIVGGKSTDAATARIFGGNKFPVLVRNGHRVTVELSVKTRRGASLGYGPHPDGPSLGVRDGHRVVTFVACKRGTRSGSKLGQTPVTFWSGFVEASSPRCVPLRVWVDNEQSPRRVGIPLGADCP